MTLEDERHYSYERGTVALLPRYKTTQIFCVIMPKQRSSTDIFAKMAILLFAT